MIQNTEVEDKEIQYSDTEEEDVVAEIPKEVRVLQTQAYDKSVSDLVSMMKSHDISLDPDYQRNYIWDNKKASLLIESILLNVPIPVVYVAEEKNNTWTVVDGLQRLNSLRRFWDNEFRLSGLEVLTELNGEQFSKLNPKATRIFKNGIFRIIVILQESNPEIKYDIFLRLNRGSIKLNEQELRNCLYRGRFNDTIKELREYPNFLQCIGLKSPHNRFNDAELVLRYLALSNAYDKETGIVKNYPNKMKTFLNKYMESNLNISEDEIDEMKRKFKATVDKVFITFGENSFRRTSWDGTVDNRMNRALMDVIMISLENIPMELVVKNKIRINELNKKLPQKDMDFNDSLIYGTSDTKRLHYRLSAWNKELRDIIGN